MKSLLILLFMALWGLINGFNAHSSEIEKYDRPMREISLILAPEGVYPKSIFAYKGEKVRFYLTATTKKPSCFMVPSHEVFVGVEPNEVSEVTLEFKREGEIQFHCPSGEISGKISIYEHPHVKRERMKREIASKNREKKSNVKVWSPKDDMDSLYSP